MIVELLRCKMRVARRYFQARPIEVIKRSYHGAGTVRIDICSPTQFGSLSVLVLSISSDQDVNVGPF